MKTTHKAGIGAIAGSIISAIVAIEGGYVNNPEDPGGETNYGITKQVALSHGYTGDMKDIPSSVVNSIYYQDYIVKPGYLPMLTISPPVAEKLIDESVNVGVKRPACWFQQTLNALNRNGKDYSPVTEDCVVGASTIQAYESLEKVRGKTLACELTIKMLDGALSAHYYSLTGMRDFIVGWFTYRVGDVPLTRCETQTVGALNGGVTPNPS